MIIYYILNIFIRFIHSDTNTLTIHFNGFKSDECGIRFYEWGVGTTSYLTDVMPFTSSGLVMRNETHGQAQGFVSLRHGQVRTFYDKYVSSYLPTVPFLAGRPAFLIPLLS